MANPFADPAVAELRTALQTKREEAGQKWAAFEAERKKHIEAGTDLKDGSKAATALKTLHEEYEAAAGEYGDLEEQLWKRIDAAAGHKGSKEVLPTAIPRGLGAAFLKGLGASSPSGMTGIKALVSGASPVPPFFDPQIRALPARQLFVRSLIPTTVVDSEVVQFTRQTVATQNAAPVAAGAIKPTSVFTIERVQQPVRVIGHVTEALDRSLLSDYDEVESFIDSQLRLGVLLAEEAQVLNGSGAGVNLTGILNTAGILTQARGTDSHADAIHKAITKIRVSGFMEPDGVVLHPNDWEDVRLAKTADLEYLSAPVVEADPDRIFGKQVITSPVIAEGTGLVGAFAEGCRIWVREDAVVSFTESGLSDAAGTELFVQNQIRWRGEERIAFGVIRPAAFASVTAL
jgi:HK97 family phage major capsid protein